MDKVSIIGAGLVGSTAAFVLARTGLCEIVLIDIQKELAQGKALDIAHAMPSLKNDVAIHGGDDFSLIKNSDIVIITAGTPRKIGGKREDLFVVNKKIVTSICENIKKYAPESIVIIVTNPLDLMARVAYDCLGFEKERVMGMGNELDSLRFAYFIREYSQAMYKEIDTKVIGMHGEIMIPVPEISTIKGIPISEVLAPQEIEEIVEKTKKGGYEVFNLLQQSAYCATAEAIKIMVQAILKDTKEQVCACVLLDGEYGIKDVFLGVPLVLGRKGIEKIVQVKLTDETQKELEEAAKEVKELLK